MFLRSFGDITSRSNHGIFRLVEQKRDSNIATRRDTEDIEVDGLSVYRCFLWDTSSVRNDGQPAFLQPLGCLHAPLGPVIKTRTSQHSTMKVPLPSLCLNKRRALAGSVADYATTRKLQSIVVNSQNKGNRKRKAAHSCMHCRIRGKKKRLTSM